MGKAGRNWVRRGTLVGVLIGLLIGFVFSLAAGPLPAYLAPMPTATVHTNPAGLDRALTARDYIVLVSALYAVDGDKDRAQARLEQLGLKNGPEAVADLAEALLKEGQKKPLLVDLSTLARDLGGSRPALTAYMATAVPKVRPKPTVAAIGPAATATPVPSTPTPLPTVDWDIRLSAKLEPPVKLIAAEVKSGQTYWRLIRAWWQSPEEGHNAFHIFANVLNKDGVAISQPIMIENGGKRMIQPELKPDSEYLINYPMAGTLGSYTCYVAGDWPSDRVAGLGLGFAKGGKDHTVFILLFQETVAP